MSNGDDIRPNPFPFPDFSRPVRGSRSQIPIDLGPFREALAQFLANLAAVPTTPPASTPVPRPVPPPRIIFPNIPAANDPVFSRAGTVLRAGNIVVGAAIIIDVLLRKAQDLTIEREEREREADFESFLRRRRRLALEKEPRTILFPSPAVLKGEEFPLPDLTEIPEQPLGRPAFDPIDQPDVVVPAPVRLPSSPAPAVTPPTLPVPASSPTPIPVGTPGIGTNPGVFTPPGATPAGSPLGVPGAFPISFPVAPPVSFPVFTPIGDLFPSPPLTTIDPVGVGSSFADVLDFPQPQPSTDPARRCRPCPEEDPPTARDACFKGLYREGRLSNDVDFTEWAEINCETGEEI